MKKMPIFVLVLLALALTLSGCGGTKVTSTVPSKSEVQAKAPVETLTEEEPAAVAEPVAEAEAPAASSDALSIPLSSLNAEPSFVDWEQDGQPMQLIALVNDANEVRVAYNTCQSCAGSPYAYFEYANGILTCQNCGNQFTLDSVGAVVGGCNPMPVGEASIEGDSLVIPASELKSVAPAFATWKKF